MKKLKRISKYALIIVGMLAALNWVWSCAEEELTLKDKIQNKIPKEYTLMDMKDGNIPNDLLGEIFAEGNIPPQEVLDAADFPDGESAADYQWAVHLKTLAIDAVDDQESGFEDVDDNITGLRILKPNEELQAYIGVKGDVLGNGGKLAIVANDASVVIEDWLESDEWKNATTKGNAFDVSYSEETDEDDLVWIEYIVDIDFHLNQENNQDLIETLRLYDNSSDDEDIEKYRLQFFFSYFYKEGNDKTKENLVYFHWWADLLTEPLTLADKAKQERIVVDDMVFVYPDSNDYPTEGTYLNSYVYLPLHSVSYESLLEELRKFSDPN